MGGAAALILSLSRVCSMIGLIIWYFSFHDGASGTSSHAVVAAGFGVAWCFDPIYFLSADFNMLCAEGPYVWDTRLVVVAILCFIAFAIVALSLNVCWQHASAKLDDMCLSDSDDEG